MCNENDPTNLQIEDQVTALSSRIEETAKYYAIDQGNILTEELELLYKKRDACVVGIRQMVEAQTRHCDETTQQAAKLIQKAFDKYGKGIERYNYRGQTETLTNLIADLKTDADLVAAVSTLNLGNWIDEMETLNNDFFDMYRARTNGYVSGLDSTMFDVAEINNHFLFSLTITYTNTKAAQVYT